MSLAVSPSPSPLSGSSLVADVSTNVGLGSQTSLTLTCTWIVASLWLGGQSLVRSSVTSIAGSWVSCTVTLALQLPVLNESSVEEKVTVVSPSGKNPGALLPIVREASQMSEALAPDRNEGIGGSVARAPLLPVHS